MSTKKEQILIRINELLDVRYHVAWNVRRMIKNVFIFLFSPAFRMLPRKGILSVSPCSIVKDSDSIASVFSFCVCVCVCVCEL